MSGIGGAGARRDRAAAPGGGARARACLSGQPHEIAERIEALGVERGHRRARAGSSRRTTRRSRSQRQWQARTAGGLRLRRRRPGRPRDRRRCCQLPRGDAEDRPRAHPPAAAARRRGPPQHRPRELAQPGDRPHRSAPAAREGSLLSAIDRTRTSMGGRLLRQWLRYPLCDLEHIAARQSAIAALLESPAALRGDRRERSTASATSSGSSAAWRSGARRPRDLAGLAQVPRRRCRSCSIMLQNAPGSRRRRAGARCAARRSAPSRRRSSPARSCPTPPPHLREGGVIARGFDAELDRLRDIGTNSQQWLAQYQARAGRRERASRR